MDFFSNTRKIRLKAKNKRKNAYKKSGLTEFDVSLRINVMKSCPVILKVFLSIP